VFVLTTEAKPKTKSNSPNIHGEGNKLCKVELEHTSIFRVRFQQRSHGVLRRGEGGKIENFPQSTIFAEKSPTPANASDARQIVLGAERKDLADEDLTRAIDAVKHTLSFSGEIFCGSVEVKSHSSTEENITTSGIIIIERRAQ
jgi:hypothetical protein